MKTTSATQKPNPHPFYGDSYERGLDPWHPDAFPPEFKHAAPSPAGPRGEGWFLIDGCGNMIGYVPDGTPIDRPAESKIVVVAKDKTT